MPSSYQVSLSSKPSKKTEKTLFHISKVIQSFANKNLFSEDHPCFPLNQWLSSSFQKCDQLFEKLRDTHNKNSDKSDILKLLHFFDQSQEMEVESLVSLIFSFGNEIMNHPLKSCNQLSSPMLFGMVRAIIKEKFNSENQLLTFLSHPPLFIQKLANFLKHNLQEGRKTPFEN